MRMRRLSFAGTYLQITGVMGLSANKRKQKMRRMKTASLVFHLLLGTILKEELTTVRFSNKGEVKSFAMNSVIRHETYVEACCRRSFALWAS